MKKTKQILAICGIIFLVSLYVITLICAITDNSATMHVFFASVFSTVVIPVLLWAYSFIYRLIRKNAKEQEEKLKEESKGSLTKKANMDTKK